MATAFTTCTDGGTSTTYSVTVSGSNPLLVCLINAQTGTDVVTGVTWNGETLTRIIWSNDDVNIGLWMYACIPVGTGAHNMVISLSSGVIKNSQSNLFSGPTSIPTVSAKNNAASGTAISVPLSGGSGDWLIGYGGTGGGGGVTAGSNTTIRGGPSGTFSATSCDSNGVASPTALNLNSGISGGWSIIGAVISSVQNITLSAGTGAFTFTGTAAIIGRLQTLIAGVGSFILTGISATLSFRGWTKQAKSATATWTKQSKS